MATPEDEEFLLAIVQRPDGTGKMTRARLETYQGKKPRIRLDTPEPRGSRVRGVFIHQSREEPIQPILDEVPRYDE